MLRPQDGRVEAVIEYLWALPRGESSSSRRSCRSCSARRSLVSATRAPTELSLKLRLLIEPGVVVADVPVLATRPASGAAPATAVCRVLVSGAHAATMRAVHYARTLGFEDTRAVFFAFDAEEVERMRHEWALRPMPIPLEIDEAPFRDIGEPLLRYLRAITAEPDAVAVVVMPELIFRGWSACCTTSARSTSSGCSSSSRA